MTMPNFCINFLNKAAKSLSILYDFAVASLADAWIKMVDLYEFLVQNHVAPLTGAWIKTGSIIVARKRMNVASLADAWIKIIVPKTSKTLSLVASFA